VYLFNMVCVFIVEKHLVAYVPAPPGTAPEKDRNATRCFSTIKTHTMLNKYTVQLMALGIAGSLGATAFANDSALIDALVKKGVLKTKEAEQIRAEAARSSHQGSGSKLNLDSSVKSLVLSGDVRVRYNYVSATDGVAPAKDTIQNSFYELRLRLNADYQLSDDFFAGFGLRTDGSQSGLAGLGVPGQTNRNDNARMGNGFDGHAFTVHRAFLGWNPLDGVSLVAGKQANPFYTTELVWDADIFPTGFSQKIDLNKTLGVSGIDLTLVSGQYVMADNQEDSADDHSNRDSFLWQTQLVAGIDLGGAKLTFAPGYLSTNGATPGVPPVNPLYRYMNDYQILLLPGDISGEVAGIKAKFLWDFAYNFAGRDRAINQSGITDPRSGEKLAFLLGVKVGENKKKGDLSAYVNYRRTGEGIPPLLADNDFAFGDGRNMQGFKFGAAYNLGDAATFGVNYYRFTDIRSDNPSGFDNGDILQAEVGVKF